MSEILVIKAVKRNIVGSSANAITLVICKRLKLYYNFEWRPCSSGDYEIALT